MKEVAAPHKSCTPLPQPTHARKQMQRKYYNMRRRPFQAVPGHNGKEECYMVIRQLEQRAFERLHSALVAQAQAEPLEASYTVNLAINSAEYAVRVQPDEGNRMAVLQALRVYREEDGMNFELIEQRGVLSAFLEILIYQGVG